MSPRVVALVDGDEVWHVIGFTFEVAGEIIEWGGHKWRRHKILASRYERIKE